MSLYGIYTEQDCKTKFDELLALNRVAQETMTKKNVAAIKTALHDYYKQGEHKDATMTGIEKAFFFPAIQESFVKSPSLNSRATWQTGLQDIEFYLTYYLKQL
jgi:hypothetical protein